MQKEILTAVLKKNSKFTKVETPRIELTFKIITNNVFPNKIVLVYNFEQDKFYDNCVEFNKLFNSAFGSDMDIEEIDNIHKLHYQLSKVVGNEVKLKKKGNKYEFVANEKNKEE